MQYQRTKKQKGSSMDIVPSSSTSHPKRKGKEVARQDSDVEDEDVPQLVRKRKPPTKPKKKPSSKPTKNAMVVSDRADEETFQHLMSKTWVPTRWAHPPTLQELGLLEDYKRVCRELGIGNFLHRGGGGDKELTCEFLSSLSYNKKNATFTFSIGMMEVKGTVADINDIFGFSQGTEMVIPSMRNLDQEKWKMIGDGTFVAGTKASRIRHPVLRYIHKCLAHTIFARKESGKLNTDELYILLKGAERIRSTVNPRALPDMYPQLNFGSVLLTSFLDMRKTFLRSKDNTQQLMIGGIVQPILEHCSNKGLTINFPSEPQPHLLIDIPYLLLTRFLKGKHNDKFKYSMSLEKLFLLPNINATTLSNTENLTFKPQVGYVDDEEEEEVAPANEEVFGSRRYHFDIYEEPSTARALSNAQDHIEKLQKWNKWQDRTIHKLVKAAREFKKQAKSLKEQVKTLTRRLSCEGTSNPQEEEEEPRISYIASLPHEKRPAAKLRIRRRRQMRSPSPPSSNPSPSLSEEDEPSTPQPA